MRYYFSFCIIFLSFSCFGQEVNPFEMEDASALKIDRSALQQILGQEWILQERKMYIKGLWSSSKQGSTYVINDDCTYETLGRNGGIGEWELLGEKLFHFKPIVLDKSYDELHKKDPPFSPGGYSLIQLSDNKMMLRKNLTSSFDNKLVLVFVAKDQFEEIVEEEVAIEFEPPTPSKVNLYTKYGEELSKTELISKLRAEHFMRNMKLPADLENKSKKEVQQFYLDFLKKNKG